MELPCASSGQDALEVATRAARAAGAIIREKFRGSVLIEHKGKSNIVTDVDRTAEKTITQILQTEFPSHGILAEESGKTGPDSPYTWIIDPLDGTNNYAFGLPFVAVSIALTSGDDILLGVVYDPLREELFHSQKGKGAWFKKTRIHVSPEENLVNAFVGSDIGYDMDKGKQMLETLAMLWPKTHGVRITGSAVLGLAYVACGRMGLYVHRNLYPWDLAAGMLLVWEAGGVVTDWQGKEAGVKTRDVVAGNKKLVQEFVELVPK